MSKDELQKPKKKLSTMVMMASHFTVKNKNNLLKITIPNDLFTWRKDSLHPSLLPD